MARLVERMTAKELAQVKYKCAVCRGISPESDGHDQYPPCTATAYVEIVTRAIAWDKLQEMVRL